MDVSLAANRRFVMCYKLLKLAVITTALLLSGWAVAVPVPFADANKERAAAIKAEKKGDYAAAPLHYEIF